MREARRKLKVFGSREVSIFASLTDAFCAPEPAYPPVGETDAVAFADDLVASSPRRNRIGFRVMLWLLDLAPLVRGYRARFRRLDGRRRAQFLRGLDSSRLAPVRIAARLLKTVAMVSYYGDVRVLRAAGYDPDANVLRGRALREKEGRP